MDGVNGEDYFDWDFKVTFSSPLTAEETEDMLLEKMALAGYMVVKRENYLSLRVNWLGTPLTDVL